MNSFGRLFRISIWGESHGPAVGIVIDGCPAGVPLREEDFLADLSRRRPGEVGTTRRHEADVPQLLSGLFNGHTTGAPICLSFANEDVQSAPYETIRHTPRPGHADFTARQKFGGFHDYRGGGHFSGRLTAGLVAAGVIAKKLLPDVQIEADVISIGGKGEGEAELRAALADRDSIGGIVECRAMNVPLGLGEPFFDSVEALIAHLAFSIPGVRGIEFGSGFACADMRGSECNDNLQDVNGRTATNHAGGVNGGITNGNDLVFRVAVKPPSSIALPQQTIDLKTGETRSIVLEGRHDACIALRVPPILEAICAVALADLTMIAGHIPRIWNDR